MNIDFPTDLKSILQRIDEFNPTTYGKTRNFIDGTVSSLSPYISRGVISTKFVYQHLLKKGIQPNQMFKFIQELAWRDYWQQVWIVKGNDIDSDIKNIQKPIVTNFISKAINRANTGIHTIDNAIEQFYSTGYIHNHIRMYLASIACNIGQNHWLHPAKWMYYYLLDADWASNALSWQWVAGANSNKKYYANQENINNFCYDNQRGTFLDVPYEDFDSLSIPKSLLETEKLELNTPLPKSETIIVNQDLPTCIYTFYNLDPFWKKNINANRILLLEPSFFKKYPVSKKTIDFLIALSKNIKNIQICVCEFDNFKTIHNLKEIYYKEHPTNIHYQGIKDSRDWMFSVEGYYPSFFAFWKKCKKEIIF